MADFWWNPDDTFEDEKIPAITDGFEQPKETPYTSLSSDTPDDVEAIPFQVGDSRMPSQYGMRKTDSGVEFWNRERGERLEGEEAQFAQQLLEDSGLPDATVAHPGRSEREAGEAQASQNAQQNEAEIQARREERGAGTDRYGYTNTEASAPGFSTGSGDNQNLSFRANGTAELQTTSWGKIDAYTTRRLSPSQAREVITTDLGMTVPDGEDPKEFLAEYLRNQRR